MRISPKDASRFHIPLYRMVYMPLVRPTLAYDIKKLEAEFTHGYRPGAPVFYVSICNEHTEERFVTDEDIGTWGPHWTAANTEFEAKLASNPDLNFLSSRIFFICDGNHRYKAWIGCIQRLHSTERKWHYAVDSICLDTCSKEGQLLNAMHDINKSTEHSHVKTNIVHILHRVKAVGSQPLESFKGMLTPDEYHRCQSIPQLRKTWFKLTTDVFIAILFRQEIAEASDDAARKYSEETEEKDKTSLGVTFAMRAAAKNKLHSFKGQFSKFLAVANPKLGDEFLHEVTKHWSNNEKPKMTLEKLQMIATAAAAPDHKVRWLQQWNSSSMTRKVLHFPAKGFSEKDFEAWLNRASFWAGLEDGAVAMYSRTVDEDGLEISTLGDVEPRTVAEYVKAWRNQIWDFGFPGWFKGKDSYSKTKAFDEHRCTDLVVKRVIYRYFMREFVQHGAVVMPELPIFLTSWVDKSSTHCMYTMTQIRTWSVSHLKAGCWFIDYLKTFCRAEEEVVKAAGDRADSKDAAPDTNEGKTKATTKKKKGDDKAENTKEKVKKVGKKGEKSGKERSSSPPLLLTEAPAATPSQTARKRDASAADLTMSRLQQLASPAVKGYSGIGSMLYAELVLCTSLVSIDAHHEAHEAFPKEWKEMEAFLKEHKSDKPRSFEGVQGNAGGVDLMLVDIPEGLPVPLVSSPRSAVRDWNSIHESVPFLSMMFELGGMLVHDNGAILLFHKDDLQLRADIRGTTDAYNWKILKEWTGINLLPLTSARDASKITQKFCIQLLVRNNEEIPPSTFFFRAMGDPDSRSLDVANNDVLFNLVTKDSQLMNGSIPWRGGREKDPLLLQLLIESTASFGNTILDCTASTGASIHACRKAGRHLMAMEGDKEIFKGLLEPLIVDPVSEALKKQRLEPTNNTPILQGTELAPIVVVRLNRYSRK